MSERNDFERAFVATCYLLGRRRDLARGLGPSAGGPAVELEQALLAGAREDRARRLASELLPVVEALEARRLR